uniref:Mediator of RNA polymerase II transcription subunit 20 n=1 Tax=Arundo donax TaxID=35708 RepID=A0A0A9FES1_ARUDO
MHWHPSPGATLNTQILAEACGCAESLGGVKDGRWNTSIFYRPMTRDGAGGAGQQHPDVPRAPRAPGTLLLHRPRTAPRAPGRRRVPPGHGEAPVLQGPRRTQLRGVSVSTG